MCRRCSSLEPRTGASTRSPASSNACKRTSAPTFAARTSCPARATGCSRSSPSAPPSCSSISCALFKDLVDAGFGALGVVLAAAGAAGRAGDANGADHAIAGADRHAARRRRDVRQEDRPEVGKLLHALAVLRRRHLVAKRGVGLAEAG